MALRASRSDLVRVSSTGEFGPFEILALARRGAERPSHHVHTPANRELGTVAPAISDRDGSSDLEGAPGRRPRPRPSRAGSPPATSPACSAPVHDLRHRVLPRARGVLPQPGVPGAAFDEVELSRTGHSVVLHRRPVPAAARPTSPPTDPYEPFALAAVELADEQLVVLGQVASGYGVDDLTVGTPVELVVEPLYEDDGVDHLIWRWKPVGRWPAGAVSGRHPRGRHAPVGQVGPALPRVRRAPRWPRSPTPGSTGPTCSSSSAARPCATATPATSPARPSPRRSAGTAPASPPPTPPAPPGPGPRRRPGPDPRRPVRRRPRRRRRHHAQGLPRPQRRRAVGRPRLAALPPARHDQPGLLRALRPPAHGPLRRHRAGLRHGEGQERPPRPRPTRTPATARRSPRRRCWRRRWWPTRCACSRSAPPPTAAAAVVLTSMEFARRGTASTPCACGPSRR